jgi:hypothetical protein
VVVVDKDAMGSAATGGAAQRTEMSGGGGLTRPRLRLDCSATGVEEECVQVFLLTVF